MDREIGNRTLPPKEKRQPSEVDVVRRWTRTISRYAVRVHSPHRLNMTLDDVRQELNSTVIMFHRDWCKTHDRWPDDPLVRHAIIWRVKKLNRDSLTKFRSSMDQDEMSGDLDLVPVTQLDGVEISQRNEACATLFYGLRDHMEPASLALLWLRHGEGLTPSEISEFVGCDNRTVSRRLYRATAAAREFLSTLGITDWSDVENVSAEEILK